MRKKSYGIHDRVYLGFAVIILTAIVTFSGCTQPSEPGAAPTLVSIAVTGLPAKTIYVKGESLDLTGLEVTGTYSDGSTRVEAVTGENITGYDTDKAEVQTLTVTVRGKTATFTVTVADSAASAAAAFKTAHSAVLGKTVSTIAVTDEAAVNAALTAYNALSTAVKDLLGTEKTLLDNLKTKIDELGAAAFKTTHSVVLAKTVVTVAITDEAAVTAALTAYNALSAEAKALLGTEKTLLDGLKTQIDALKAAVNAGKEDQDAAAAFKTAHSAVLAKTTDTVAVTDEAAVDAALTAYNTLSAVAQTLLGTEKILLDGLKAKVDELKSRPIITISDGQMVDEAFTLTPLSLYRGDPAAARIATFTLGTGYTAITWSVGAAVLGWADGANTFTFDAADWPAGTYILGVTVEKAGKSWSKNVTIIVANGVSPNL